MKSFNPEVFFIDGHFLPYYGLKVLAKGYHTVRRTIMKGNEIYVVSDIDGKPLFSITEGCDIDFRPIIIRAADKIISMGIDRPILVFDRGGYGVHFFSELSTRADFVTWAKYVKKDELKNLEYTSNHQKPAPDIAAYMLSRWGESENFFKEIMSLYNFNYHPGYDLKELEEQPFVNNPEVKTIKKTIKGIKQKMGQLALAKQETESKINSNCWDKT